MRVTTAHLVLTPNPSPAWADIDTGDREVEITVSADVLYDESTDDCVLRGVQVLENSAGLTWGDLSGRDRRIVEDALCAERHRQDARARNRLSSLEEHVANLAQAAKLLSAKQMLALPYLFARAITNVLGALEQK